jgi:hypothetical protein
MVILPEAGANSLLLETHGAWKIKADVRSAFNYSTYNSSSGQYYQNGTATYGYNSFIHTWPDFYTQSFPIDPDATTVKFNNADNSGGGDGLYIDNIVLYRLAASTPATRTVTLHPGDHGSIAGANTNGNYGVTVTNGAAFPAVTVNAAAGWTFTGWNPPAPATVTNDFEATAQYQQLMRTLTVASAHGTPDPTVGAHTYAWGGSVLCRASGVETLSLTRYLCTGWSGTGSVPFSGGATNVSFTITNDSGIVWNWATEHRLSAETAGGLGWLSVTGAWVTAGSTATVSAVAADGYRFKQWLVDGQAPDSATTNFVTGGGTNTLVVSLGAPHALTAEFAALGLPEALDNVSLVWTTGGATNWVGQSRVTFDGVDAAGSGMVSNSAQSWLDTSVTNGGTLTFVWRVSSKELGGLLRFEVDGEVYGLISGETAWRTNSVTVPYGCHTFRWVYAKGKIGAAGADRGWVDQVVWTPLPPLSLAIAVNATNLVWTTAGDSAWFPQTAVTGDGIAAAQAGAVGDLG